jgi:heme-degrading monooxygenase HmoA
MLTTIGMHYEVREGKEGEFEAGFLSTLKVMEGMAGHVESHMYRDIQVEGSYVILSQWKSKGDFDAFLKSKEFSAAVAWGKAEILRGRPRHKVYLEG